MCHEKFGMEKQIYNKFFLNVFLSCPVVTVCMLIFLQQFINSVAFFNLNYTLVILSFAFKETVSLKDNIHFHFTKTMLDSYKQTVHS